jgi:hypothetical protein
MHITIFQSDIHRISSYLRSDEVPHNERQLHSDSLVKVDIDILNHEISLLDELDGAD